MNKVTIAAAIATLFLLLGPYFGLHLFGNPESRLLSPSENRAVRPPTTGYSDDVDILPYYDPNQDDGMEPVPSDELSNEIE